MTNANHYPESDPRHHTLKIKSMLQQSISHVRGDIGKTRDPKAQALFETTAEVLNGLVTAYEHFEKRSEDAWK